MQSIRQGLLPEGGGDDEVPVDHHRIAKRQYVLVLETRREPNLALDQIQRRLVQLIKVRNFERDRDPFDRVVRFVHGRKRSNADSASNSVLTQRLPRLQRRGGRPAPCVSKNVPAHDERTQI